MEEGGSKEVWGRVGVGGGGGGDGLLSWVGVLMDVVYGEVSAWDGRILAKTLILLLGWGVE